MPHLTERQRVKKYGIAVRSARNEMGRTQVEAAKILHCSVPTLSWLENGRPLQISFRLLFAIEYHMGVKP